MNLIETKVQNPLELINSLGKIKIEVDPFEEMLNEEQQVEFSDDSCITFDLIIEYGLNQYNQIELKGIPLIESLKYYDSEGDEVKLSFFDKIQVENLIIEKLTLEN